MKMANEKKLTKREKFEMLKGIADVKANPILAEFIDHELELLAKKNSTDKKPTAVQIANEGIKDVIYSTLSENGGKMTITELMKANEELGELSNQRISALIRQLVADGKVERTEEKRKAYFKVA